MNHNDQKIISQTALFSGLSEERTGQMLLRMGASESSYRQGQVLQAPESPMEHFGIVLAGTVQVYRDEPDGTRLLMASNSAGGSFGESLCYLKAKEAMVTIIAASECRVLWLKMDAVWEPEEDGLGREIVSRVMAVFARRVLAMNDRIQILSQRTLRKKIMTFLMQTAQRSGIDTFEIPLSREDMAVFLGCDRSALSRALAALKKDGLIDYYLRTFKVIKYE